MSTPFLDPGTTEFPTTSGPGAYSYPAMTDPVDFAVSVHGTQAGRPTLVVRGEVDLAAVEPLDAAVVQVLPQVTQCLVFDLSECSYMDSSGLGVLLRALRQVPESCPVVLHRPQRRVMQVLAITKMDTMFTIETE
jgi:anti-sigma B factor antagonist